MAKFYPVGKQSFEDTILGDYKYIDKTARIYEMIQGRTMVFLSRPRRFGKTFLLDTLNCYFEGKKNLFKGLAMEKLEKNWIKYPVIRLDMHAFKEKTLEELPGSIALMLSGYEKTYGIEGMKGENCGDRFGNLIKTAYQKTGRKVVILVDEYDSLLLNHLHDGCLEEYKRILSDIYIQLKVNENIEQFVFITGITRFSQVSIFSTLNNLRNLSMDNTFSDICGFSKEEVMENFAEDIEMLAKEHRCDTATMLERLKMMYDGYHFSGNGKDIFNPISLFTAFETKELSNYWFETGTPSFLIDHLKHFGGNILEVENKKLFETDFYTSSDNFKSIYPLMYQSGYLTIKDYDRETKRYVLNYPNTEVRVSMMETLIPDWVGCSADDGKSYMADFYFAIKNGNIDEGFGILKDFFYQIPYMLNNKEEKHYQTIIYVLFTWLGFYNKVEVYTATGRIDSILFSEKYIFIIEFKVDESAQTALNQINNLNYASKYLSDGRQIIKVGVNLSSANRTINEWIIEEHKN